MRNYFKLLVFISFSSTVGAFAVSLALPHRLEVVTTVHSVHSPLEGESFYRINSVADGRVYKIATEKAELLPLLNLAKETHAPVTLHLTPGNIDFIHSAEVLEASPLTTELRRSLPNERTLNRRSGFTPSVIENKNEADALFNSVFSYARGYNVSDHCYDRAHYWARSFELNQEINSMKVFIFFTPQYQQKHDYKWWFHVAPFVYVGASEKEYVLDPTYQEGPMTIKNWAASFASESRKGCEPGDNLRAYEDADVTVDCVLVQASMYHYTPNDLYENPSLDSWNCSDLKAVTKGIPAPFKKSSWSEITGFIPAECR